MENEIDTGQRLDSPSIILPYLKANPRDVAIPKEVVTKEIEQGLLVEVSITKFDSPRDVTS